MYLYVDDVRTAPPLADAITRDYASTIQILRLLTFDIIDLDYAMGPGGNGLQILEYMVSNKIQAKEIRVHTDHSIGRPLMLEYIRTHKEKLIKE